MALKVAQGMSNRRTRSGNQVGEQAVSKGHHQRNTLRAPPPEAVSQVPEQEMKPRRDARELDQGET